MHRSKNGCRLATLLLAVVTTGCSGPVVDVVDADGFRKAIDEHRGKVVLVDFWATWCDPCKKLFPHTVQMHRRYADRGLAVICVSFDDPEDIAAVRDFLRAQSVTFPSFISRYGAGTESVDRFHIEDGVLPHFKVFDRQGTLRHELLGSKGFEPQQVEKAVEELLAND